MACITECIGCPQLLCIAFSRKRVLKSSSRPTRYRGGGFHSHCLKVQAVVPTIMVHSCMNSATFNLILMLEVLAETT